MKRPSVQLISLLKKHSLLSNYYTWTLLQLSNLSLNLRSDLQKSIYYPIQMRYVKLTRTYFTDRLCMMTKWVMDHAKSESLKNWQFWYPITLVRFNDLSFWPPLSLFWTPQKVTNSVLKNKLNFEANLDPIFSIFYFYIMHIFYVKWSKT